MIKKLIWSIVLLEVLSVSYLNYKNPFISSFFPRSKLPYEYHDSKLLLSKVIAYSLVIIGFILSFILLNKTKQNGLLRVFGFLSISYFFIWLLIWLFKSSIATSVVS
jgi:hypothetical protein